MKKNVKYFFILLLITLFSPIFSLDKEIKLQLKTKLNFTEEQVITIENFVSDAVNKKLPKEPLEKLLNESISKKVHYDQLFLVLKKTVDLLQLAKTYIETTQTEKFFPKDKVYSISLLSELIRFGLTEEEFKKLISLLSTQNNSYEESLAKINYYLVFKKYFNSNESFLKVTGVNNPAEIIFFKYFTRPVKEFSLIIKVFTKYCNTNLDKKRIYNFLYTNNDLPTKKLVEKIEEFVKEDFKSELRK